MMTKNIDWIDILQPDYTICDPAYLVPCSCIWEHLQSKMFLKHSGRARIIKDLQRLHGVEVVWYKQTKWFAGIYGPNGEIRKSNAPPLPRRSPAERTEFASWVRPLLIEKGFVWIQADLSEYSTPSKLRPATWVDAVSWEAVEKIIGRELETLAENPAFYLLDISPHQGDLFATVRNLVHPAKVEWSKQRVRGMYSYMYPEYNTQVGLRK